MMDGLLRFILAVVMVAAFPGMALAKDAIPDPVEVSSPVWHLPPDVPDPGVRPEPEPDMVLTMRQPSADAKKIMKSVRDGAMRAGHAASLPAAPASRSVRTYTLRPVTAFGSQAAIDRGSLVTWMTRPTCLLAGHDNKGWAWLDNIPNGSIIRVTQGPCAGRYKVVTHRWQARKGGPIPSWMSNYDLVLQTCTGARGMGFSAARRL